MAERYDLETWDDLRTGVPEREILAAMDEIDPYKDEEFHDRGKERPFDSSAINNIQNMIALHMYWMEKIKEDEIQFRDRMADKLKRVTGINKPILVAAIRRKREKIRYILFKRFEEVMAERENRQPMQIKESDYVDC